MSVQQMSVRQMTVGQTSIRQILPWAFAMGFLYLPPPKGKGKAPEGGHFASTNKNYPLGQKRDMYMIFWQGARFE